MKNTKYLYFGFNNTVCNKIRKFCQNKLTSPCDSSSPSSRRQGGKAMPSIPYELGYLFPCI